MGREVKRVTYSAWSRGEGEGEDNWSLCCFDLSLLFRVRELSSLTHSSASFVPQTLILSSAFASSFSIVSRAPRMPKRSDTMCY
jgi:hypothetical protein